MKKLIICLLIIIFLSGCNSKKLNEDYRESYVLHRFYDRLMALVTIGYDKEYECVSSIIIYVDYNYDDILKYMESTSRQQLDEITAARYINNQYFIDNNDKSYKFEMTCGTRHYLSVGVEQIEIHFHNVENYKKFNIKKHKDLLEYIGLYKYYDEETGFIFVDCETLANDDEFPYQFIIQNGEYRYIEMPH